MQDIKIIWNKQYLQVLAMKRKQKMQVTKKINWHFGHVWNKKYWITGVAPIKHKKEGLGLFNGGLAPLE